MKFYTSDGCSYEGMDQATIVAMRTELGLSTTFVDKAAFDAYIASLRG